MHLVSGIEYPAPRIHQLLIIFHYSEQPLKAWFYEARKSKWQNPGDITSVYRTASILKNNRVVFNIQGNNYRLVAMINYDFNIVYLRFIGTHEEYNKINAEEI